LTNRKLNLICRSANARTTKQNFVILGLDIVLAKWDGTAKPAPGHVPYIHTEKVARIVATAETMHNVHPSMALAFAQPDIAERIAVNYVPQTPSEKIVRRNAPAKTELAVQLRMDVATAQLVSIIVYNSNDYSQWFINSFRDFLNALLYI